MDFDDYSYEGTIVRVDDSVIEVFRQRVLGSFRVPLAWAGVSLVPNRKGDQVNVRIGQADSPGRPFYDDSPLYPGSYTFDVPAAEEPKLRAFLDAAARRAGRPG